MKIVSAILFLICGGLVYFMFFTAFFETDTSYRYEGEISPSYVMVEDLYEANDKINAVLLKISQEEFFRVFRVNLVRECMFWNKGAKCRVNQ